MRKPQAATCSIVGEDCKAPAGVEGSRTRAECFACGLPVCTAPACSRKRQWYAYGVRRICASCNDDYNRGVDVDGTGYGIPRRKGGLP